MAHSWAAFLLTLLGSVIVYCVWLVITATAFKLRYSDALA